MRVAAAFLSNGSPWFGVILPGVLKCELSGRRILRLRACAEVGRVGTSVILAPAPDDDEYPQYAEQVEVCRVERARTGRVVVRAPSPPIPGSTGYPWRFKMSDPNKRDAHLHLVRHLATVPDLHRVLVLDAENLFTSSVVLHNFPGVRRIDVPTDGDPAKFASIDPRVRVHGAMAHEVLRRGTSYDAVFLDHCRTLRSETHTLREALAKVRPGGVLAATYCVRGRGRRVTETLLHRLVGGERLHVHSYGTMMFAVYRVNRESRVP